MATVFRLLAHAITHQGLVRAANEDAVGCQPATGFFGVADGVGTFPGAARTSEAALAFLATQPLPSDPSSLARQVEQAHQAVRELAHSVSPHKGLATTLDVLRCADRHACWAHVGDSVIARAEPRQGFEPITTDHATVDPVTGRHYLNNYVGQPGPLRIDCGSAELRLGQRWLLMSDGIGKHLSLEELSRLWEVQPRPLAFCQTVVDACLNRGGWDNLSLVCLEVTPLPARLHSA